MNQSKYVFFHIYADGKWEEPVKEFLQIYRDSDLILNVNVLRVGLVGSEINQSKVIQYFINERIEFEVVARASKGWEQVTQNKLYDFALHNDGLVLYCHTKGASRQDGVNELWRRSMYYYNIGKWRLAEEKLNNGFDVAGQHWMFPTKMHPEHMGCPFFGGTVWWTSLAYIRKIGKPPANQRHDAEGWIGYSYFNNEEKIKAFDFTAHLCSHPGHIAWTPETQNWVRK